LDEKIRAFKDFNIKIANQFFILELKQLRIMLRISEILFKIIKKCYNEQIIYNTDILEFAELKNLVEPGITISPIRIDFLLKNNNQICLSDINVPGSFVLDMIWPELGIKLPEAQFRFMNKRYTILNAFPKYQEIFSKYLNSKTNIFRYLEINTTNNKEQNEFLKKLYSKISNYNFFNLFFKDVEITKLKKEEINEHSLISFFLNTNNSLSNLLESSKSIINYNFPIFANPKLIPFMDKKYPNRQFLSTILKSNELNLFLRHIPREIEQKNRSIIKRRFGHAEKGWYGQPTSQNNSVNNEKLTFRQEKLFGFKFNGSKFNRTLNTMKKLRGKKFRPNVNVRINIFELSLNSIMVTKNGKIEKIIPAVSFSARGALEHPISGPHTTIFPTIIERS